MRFFRETGLITVALVALIGWGCDDSGSSPAQEGGDAGGGAGGGGVADAAGGMGGEGGGGEADMAVADPDAGGPEPDMAVADPDMGGEPEADAAPPPPPVEGEVHGGHIVALAIADNPAGQGCRDLNGDGVADNSLSLAAALANEGLQGAIDDGSINLLPTALGLAPPGTDGEFDLALLTGDAVGGRFAVSDSALNDDGTARVVFGGTRIVGGALSAGPGNFPVEIPVGGMDLALDITDATIEGSAGIDASGFFINNGIISGIIPHDALVAALENTDFAFAAGLLPPDIDGTGNSICLIFSSVGAGLDGFPVE